MNQKSNKFCIAPWTGLQLDTKGTVRPCCRYVQDRDQNTYPMGNIKNSSIKEVFNGKEFNDLRQAFLDGVQPEECRWCWSDEDAGIESFRQVYNKKYKFENLDLNNLTPKWYDLKLNNVCNFKCRMCGSSSSSMILKEEKKLGRQFPDEQYWLSNKIIDTINEKYFFENISNIDYIELTGGEPFYSKENKDLIKKISETEYAKNITIHITTNGSILGKSIIPMLKQFKYPLITVSVDDIGPRLEYARNGAKWDIIQRNILEYKNNIKTHVYRTINNYNIWYLEDLDDWVEKNNIHLANGLLHEPHFLSVRNLHNMVKTEIYEKYKDNEKYSSILNFMVQDKNLKQIHTPSNLYAFHKEIKKLDIMRNEKFKEVFPEWSEIIMYA